MDNLLGCKELQLENVNTDVVLGYNFKDFFKTKIQESKKHIFLFSPYLNFNEFIKYVPKGTELKFLLEKNDKEKQDNYILNPYSPYGQTFYNQLLAHNRITLDFKLNEEKKKEFDKKDEDIEQEKENCKKYQKNFSVLAFVLACLGVLAFLMTRNIFIIAFTVWCFCLIPVTINFFKTKISKLNLKKVKQYEKLSTIKCIYSSHHFEIRTYDKIHKEIKQPNVPPNAMKHIKLFIIDDTAYLGSLNFTKSGIESHIESLIIIKDFEPVAKLKEYFLKHFNKGQTTDWDIFFNKLVQDYINKHQEELIEQYYK